MKITFPCTGCGKTLKARPDSAGRTRKCPVLATRVTCPEPVVVAQPVDEEIFDAEIVEAEVMPAPMPARAVARPAPADRRGGTPTGTGTAPDPARHPFDDDDGNPYGLAGPLPAPESAAAEAKKPCPICGETILASAVKCRFCGEMLDRKASKGKSKKRRKSSGGGMGTSELRDVGIGVVCMAVGIGLTVASYAAAASDSKGGGRYVVFYGLVFFGLARICRGVYSSVWSR